jgi:SAM-dependent methyltransferase
VTPEVKQWVANARGKYIPTPPGRVLEIGSLYVNGQVRDLFADAAEYIGIDLVAGLNVDTVLNGHDLLSHFGADVFDLVLCLEMLEHDSAFWLTLQAIRAVVKPGGIVCISAPGNGFPEHHGPDHWRFLPDAFKRVFFDGMELLAFERLEHQSYAQLIGIAQARSL